VHNPLPLIEGHNNARQCCATLGQCEGYCLVLPPGAATLLPLLRAATNMGKQHRQQQL